MTLLVKPLCLQEGIKTTHGEADAMECDVAVLSPRGPSVEYGVLIFQRILVSDLKRRLGDQKSPLLLGVLGTKPNKKAPDGRPSWVFEQATDEHAEWARAFLADNPEWAQPVVPAPAKPVVPARQAPDRQVSQARQSTTDSYAGRSTRDSEQYPSDPSYGEPPF